MPSLSRYPKAEAFVLGWLRAGLDPPVFTETDENLQQTAPAYKVQVVGGGEQDITRSPTVEICAYAVGRGAALDLLDEADYRMRHLRCQGTADGYADDVRLAFHPTAEPYGNTDLHQATASYTVDFRPKP